MIGSTLPRRLAAVATGFGVALACASAFAASHTRLEDVEKALKAGEERQAELAREAETLREELSRIRRETIEAARKAQEHEAAVTAIERRLSELRASEEAKRAALSEHRLRLRGTLAALQRLSLYPPEAMMIQRSAPVDTVRGALLLRAAVPEIETRARNLRGGLQELADLRRQIARDHEMLAGLAEELEGERSRLSGLLEEKAGLYRETEGARQATAERVQRLAGEAEDLRDLIAKLEADRKAEEVRRRAVAAAARAATEMAAARRAAQKPDTAGAPPADAAKDGEAPGGGAETQVAALPPSAMTAVTGLTRQIMRSFGEARGQVTAPVRGPVVQRYGTKTSAGLTSKGIGIETRENAQAVSPFDGQVVFSGPFRGYGQILIIDHGEGYHSLLAGLVRIDTLVGQWLLAGEPVGVMGRATQGSPILYVELRQNGRPVDPIPWMALQDSKESG